MKLVERTMFVTKGSPVRAGSMEEDPPPHPDVRKAATARLCTRGRQEEMPLLSLSPPHHSPAGASQGY